MKHNITLLLALCLTAFSAKAQRAEVQLSDPESFSMVVFGDAQSYTRFDQNQPILELCTAWMAGNAQKLNLQAVLFTGDVIQTNDNLVVKGRSNYNQTSRQQWQWASHCLERLDNRVPYIIAGGNHEYGFTRGDEDFTHYPEYYTPERNSKTKEHLVATFPNRMGQASLENAAWEFSTPHWGKLLIIGTEWAPRDEVLTWAKELCESDKYKDHTVIFLTHSLLKEKKGGGLPKLTNNSGYKVSNPNWGQQIWDKLLYPCKNIRLAICGHTGHPAADDGKEPGSDYDFLSNMAYRCDRNASGLSVHQMMFNVQYLSGGAGGCGGDGWLRLLEFLPDGKTIKASTYSVLLGCSPVTKHLANRTDECCKFEMVVETGQK